MGVTALKDADSTLLIALCTVFPVRLQRIARGQAASILMVPAT